MIMDVDGTLTDGKIYMGNQGEVFKAFHIKDGCAIHDILPTLNITPVILTGRISQIVKNRCDELEIKEIYQGIRNKKEKILELAEQWKIEPNKNGIYEELAYIGDDIIDLSSMKIVGFSACPKDACAEVKEIAHYISNCNAGEGAVRDIVEYYRKSVFQI